MARVEVRVSDFSGTTMEQREAALVTVRGYDFLEDDVADIDVTPDEARKLIEQDIDTLRLTVYVDGTPRHISIGRKVFEGFFPEGTDVEEVVEAARRREPQEQPTAKVVKRAATTRARVAAGKVDYTSPEHAGEVHRGRITEAEAAYVRDNLADVNERLEREGRPTIDPADPVMKKRYGF